MKKRVHLFWLVIGIFIISGCQVEDQTLEAKGKLIDQADERIEAPIDIDESIAFLEMDQVTKESKYDELDRIMSSPYQGLKISEYSQIQELDTPTAYDAFIEQSHQRAQVIYFGFDDCPFCQAFTPKINQLAQEFEVTIFYYDVEMRSTDANFDEVIDSYQISTVPHAFIVQAGQAKEIINHHYSMAEMEEFFAKYTSKYLKE